MAVLRAMAMLRYGALSAVLQPYIAIARTLSWANRNVRRHRERKGCQQHRLSHHPHVLNKSKLCGGLGLRNPRPQTNVAPRNTVAPPPRPLKISTHSSFDILFLPSGGTDTFRVYMKRRVSSRHRSCPRSGGAHVSHSGQASACVPRAGRMDGSQRRSSFFARWAIFAREPCMRRPPQKQWCDRLPLHQTGRWLNGSRPSTRGGDITRRRSPPS